MMKLTAVAGAVLTMALVGCGGGGGGSSPAVAVVAAPTAVALKSCNASGVVNTNAMYTFTNQQWQQFTGSITPGFSQCIDGTATADSASAIITWNSGTPDNTVLSYPSVVYGSVPGYNNPTPSHLPALVTALPSLKVNGSVQTTCSAAEHPCKYNTAFDLYLADSAGKKSGEVMIWTESAGQNAVQSPGYVGQYNISGNMYHVINRLITITDVQTHTSATWKYLAFVSTTPIQSFNSFDISQFIAFGLDAGGLNHLSDPILITDKLASIEMGTEVISGSGTTTIANYSIK